MAEAILGSRLAGLQKYICTSTYPRLKLSPFLPLVGPKVVAVACALLRPTAGRSARHRKAMGENKNTVSGAVAVPYLLSLLTPFRARDLMLQ